MPNKNSKSISGNYYDKYNSKNPAIRAIVKKFQRDISNFVKLIKAKRVLDVGCGEGYTTDYIRKHNKVIIKGIDIDKKIIKLAKKLHPKIKFSVSSAYKLNCNIGSFDIVIASEVLEHLENPSKAIEELKRVAKKYCIISVPNEPYWRLANIARLAYLTRLGNTPGHIQHWTKKQFKRLLERHFTKVKIKTSTLWNIALCGKQ